jgi:hypothetical protein
MNYPDNLGSIFEVMYPGFPLDSYSLIDGRIVGWPDGFGNPPTPEQVIAFAASEAYLSILRIARKRELSNEWAGHYDTEFTARDRVLGPAGKLTEVSQAAFDARLDLLSAASSTAETAIDNADSPEAIAAVQLIWPPEA